MEGIKNLPSMVKQGYYMVKLDIKKAYLHVLVDPQYRDLFRFVWKGSHYRWETMPFGLSTAPRIFTMLLRPVLRMLRDINKNVYPTSKRQLTYLSFHSDFTLAEQTSFTLSVSLTPMEIGINHSHQEFVIPVVNNSIEHVIKSLRNACAVNGLPSTLSETEQLQAEDSNRQHNHSHISTVSNQELQLATEIRKVQSNPTSVRSNPDGSVRISSEPSNVQLLNNQNECTPPRFESMESMSGLPTTHSFACYPGEDELIQFEEGFYNTDLPNLEISNLVSDDSSSSSSSSTSHVSSSTGNIPRSIDQTISGVNTNPNSTTLETVDYSTFQSHVMSIIRIQKSSTAELLMKSWEPSTLKVYSSSYTRFRNFCTSNSLNPAKITLVVFIDYLTHLFKLKPMFAFSTINGHRSMLNQLLLHRNQTDIVNDPFITRIMTGIHKLSPSSAKYQEIWDVKSSIQTLQI
ncbi:hypothetical protein ACTFIW_000828 [Dictyostelium discoideum]